MRSIMDRTICHENGRFRTLSDTNWNVNDTTLVSDWTFRLTYFAIHSWNHAPARKEALARRKYHGSLHGPPFHVKPFDFECPDSKFLIAGIPPLGMGASLRLGAVNIMMGAIATGRIPLFLNSINSTKVPNQISEVWRLANCDRLDMQCSFLPTTPCVVTLEDLEYNTIALLDNEIGNVQSRGMIANATLQAHRFLFFQPPRNPLDDGALYSRTRSILFTEAEKMVAALRLKVNGLPADMFAVLDKALEQLKEDPGNSVHNEGFPYFHRYSMIPHAIIMYMLRPLRSIQEQVERQKEKVLKESIQFDPSCAIGLPIRGSDKCEGEAKCLPFGTYMNLANEVWLEYFSGHDKGSVVITTEATDVADASRIYAASPAAIQGTLSIVMNNDDVLQDTGQPGFYHHKADDVTASTLVALKLQMHTKFTIGHCCSNFHNMLFDLLQHGCGLSDTQQCLQETANASYHACCAWSRPEECNKTIVL